MIKKLFLISLILSSITLFANEEESKELLDDAAYMECHNEKDFNTVNRKSKNFKELHTAVDGCRFKNNIDWFDDESMDVTRYLNSKYYKFKAPPKTD